MTACMTKTTLAVKIIDSQEDTLSILVFRMTTQLGIPRVVVHTNKMCVMLNKKQLRKSQCSMAWILRI